MKNLNLIFFVVLLLTAFRSFGDTPPPRSVNSVITDSSGNAIGSTLNSVRGLNVHLIDSSFAVTAASLPLPSGAATETSLLGVRTDLASVLAKMPTLVGGLVPVTFSGGVAVSNFPSSQAVTGTFWQTTQPVSIASTVPVSFSGGVAVNNFPATQPVSIASSVPVTGSFWQATQPVSISGSVPVTGSFYQATQPVSGSLGRSWSLLNTTDSVNVGNFPSSQAVTGTFWQTTQPVSGPLTDTQMRASPVPVTGSLSVSNPTDYSATGTIAANGSAVTASALNSVSDATFSLGGTWVGSLNAQGSVDGVTWDNLTMFQSAAGTSLWASTPITTNGNVRVAGIAGYKQVRVVATAWTSGTASITLNVTTGANILNVKQSNAANLKVTANLADGTGNAVSSTSGSLNANVTNFPTTQAVSGAVSVSNFPGTQPVSGTVAVSNQPTTLAVTQSTGTNLHTVVDSAPTTAVTGTFWQTTQPVSGTVSVTNLPTLGQTTMALSQPVAIASDQTPIPVANPDLYITGQSAQTAVVNNILTATAGTAANDVSGYRSGSIQIISTGTAGGFILEGSNDNVNFQSTPMYNQALTTSTPITTAVVPTASQFVYSFPIKTRYLRLRISTVVTGGTIQAFTRISQESWSPAVVNVAQSTASSLNATITGSVSVNAGSNAIGSVNLTTTTTTDIASAAITATATSATITLTNLQAVSFAVPVTVVSGTTPTLDLVVQESSDNVNWFDAYHFERISATGIYYSPLMRLNGIYVRYVRTITGTTPSFTMSLVRINKPVQAPLYRRIFDRLIAPNTLNSTSAVLIAEGCDSIQITQSAGAGATVAPVFTLEGSENNSDWYPLGSSTVTATASTVSSSIATGQLMKFARARVSTAGTAATSNYVMLKCKGA